MLDRNLPLVARDEESARFEPRHRALTQSFQRRVVDRLARTRIDDAKHLPDRPSASLGDGPAGHLLGDPVEKQNAAARVGGNHPVADRAERRAQPFALAAQFHERGVAIAVGTPDRADRGPGEHGKHEDACDGENGERRGAVIVGVGLGLMGEPADHQRQDKDARQQPPQHLARRRLLDDGGADPIFR